MTKLLANSRVTNIYIYEPIFLEVSILKAIEKTPVWHFFETANKRCFLQHSAGYADLLYRGGGSLIKAERRQNDMEKEQLRKLQETELGILETTM